MQKRVGNLRRGIAILLGIGIIINYFDRTNISVATKPFEQEFHLSAFQMGIVLSSYLWSYTLMQIPVGAFRFTCSYRGCPATWKPSFTCPY